MPSRTTSKVQISKDDTKIAGRQLEQIQESQEEGTLTRSITQSRRPSFLNSKIKLLEPNFKLKTNLPELIIEEKSQNSDNLARENKLYGKLLLPSRSKRDETKSRRDQFGSLSYLGSSKSSETDSSCASKEIEISSGSNSKSNLDERSNKTPTVGPGSEFNSYQDRTVLNDDDFEKVG